MTNRLSKVGPFNMVLRLPIKTDILTGYVDMMTFKVENDKDVLIAQKIIVTFREFLNDDKIKFTFTNCCFSSILNKYQYTCDFIDKCIWVDLVNKVFAINSLQEYKENSPYRTASHWVQPFC